MDASLPEDLPLPITTKNRAPRSAPSRPQSRQSTRSSRAQTPDNVPSGVQAPSSSSKRRREDYEGAEEDEYAASTSLSQPLANFGLQSEENDDDDEASVPLDKGKGKARAPPSPAPSSPSSIIIIEDPPADPNSNATSHSKKKQKQAQQPKSKPSKKPYQDDDANSSEQLSAYTCPICFSSPTNATLTPCGHILCGACLFTAVKSMARRNAALPGHPAEARCPVCRALIPGWDGKGGGVIGLKVRAVYSLE